VIARNNGSKRNHRADPFPIGLHDIRYYSPRCRKGVSESARSSTDQNVASQAQSLQLDLGAQISSLMTVSSLCCANSRFFFTNVQATDLFLAEVQASAFLVTANSSAHVMCMQIPAFILGITFCCTSYNRSVRGRQRLFAPSRPSPNFLSLMGKQEARAIFGTLALLFKERNEKGVEDE
jgi:hypothetical protein